MLWRSILLTPVFAWAAHPLSQQQPLKDHDSFKDIIDKLITAEIIPTVIPTTFEPRLQLEASWKHASAGLGNTISPTKLQHPPHLRLRARDAATHHALASTQLTVILSDPDAPRRDDPKWAQVCHWIVTNVTSSPPATALAPWAGYDEVLGWKPPGPPPRTGKHRYVFVALGLRNGTHEGLRLSRPEGRKRWGYGGPREGLARWMGENGLEVWGANFIYAQDEKQ